ncbi:rhamnose ABC transporter substrate-binding protein [Trinickia caryophylli]|uniref:Monosaccharide ABC transporter substrate-binding protein, CUT2 family n=1 Tax=Trinickia caryophylli TaxID=28094 RepID=A0A1X7GEN1_TRICW|nr:rhamnose ABC transporter substrate-binding protein [Trinickia caryophylli]PMS10757.1 rhamnose ABC transporter substrate-binding protein [Trinickia caryophylli]TRX13864.1 rhamnose ABC transporter substrate-binding protein [Trinickia caryophylli]WQE15455.1 rhamnose ABC transporter substrate-binding protein [Trinickia caryophylli]SMF68572.1 monosaccharide ABC transporter substrate-binding protein, CUT2 family [Trinickia caryophylli]GLU33804.1 rhamnose ABC transporter substrate-binding protein 
MFRSLGRAGTVVLCAALVGIGATAHAASIKEGLKIAFIPKQINNPYEVIADNGGMEAIKEFKGDGKVVGPSDAGASSQVQYINTMTTQRQNAIVIAANDANALVPYLKRAMSQGIKVVTFDSDTAPDGRQLFVNQANAEGIGRGQIQLVSKLMGGEGEFAILSATPNATNQNTWIKWMQEELKKPEYSKMKLVKIAYGNDDDQKSFVETQGLLQAYPNLKAIVAPTSVGIAAAARYISSSPSKGKVAVTGLGTPNQMRAFIKNGTVKAFQLWDPGQLGYLAAYAAANLASGAISGKEGESFEAGKLGKRTIGKDGEIILGPPTTFDAGNIDNFNF